MSEEGHIKIDDEVEEAIEEEADISDLRPPPVMEDEAQPFDGFDPEDLIGDTLAGRYEIERQIGRGGMGIVYLASQRALNRQVVVKVLARGLSDDDEATQRFEREALGLSQLQHPNTVTIYDFGRDRDLAYIVMEYVEGPTLSQAMRRREGGLGFEEFASISAQIVDALAEAHSLGIIHRDIKPSNIMLTERHGHANFVKVLDFGLAKLIHDAAEVTKKQNLVGSVAFLAPEQILGLEFDQRADVYALGVLFYYLLSGQKPFRGEDDISVLYQHIHKAPTSLYELLPPEHGIPNEIIDLVHVCLSKEPTERPGDARELLTLMQTESARSIFNVPWATGEFASISASNAAISREMTPISGQLAVVHSPNSGVHEQLTPQSASYPQLSQTSLTHVSGVHVLPAEPTSKKGMIFLGVAMLLTLVVAGGALFMSMNRSESQVDPATQRAQIEQVLESTDALLEQKKWGQAESMLASIRPRATAHPALLSRVAEADEKITIGKHLQQAELAEKKGDIPEARSHYEAILARDPAHELATANLSKLPGAKQGDAAAMGNITIESAVGGVVFLDGKEVGPTPYIGELPPASYKLEVRADGHKTWSKTIALEGGESVMLDATLEKERGKKKTARAGKTSRKKTSSGKPPTEKSTAPASNEEKNGAGEGDKKKTREDYLIPVDKKKKKKKPMGDLLPVGK